MKKEINEKLKILQYDKTKHSSLKAALEEILSKGKYNEIMRGIINDPTAMSEVRNILDAYKFLKDYEDSIIEDKEIAEELDEVIIFEDNNAWKKNTVILKKNKEKNNYEEIARDSNVYIGQNFFAILDTGEFYNFQGELMFKTEIDFEYNYNSVFNHKGKPCIKEITDKIIEIGYCCKDCVLLEKNQNNEYMFIKDSTLPDSIFKRPEISDKNKNKIFKMIYENKKLDYLNALKISCNDDYIYANLRNGENAYFTIDGEKIISTDKDDYCFIGRLPVDSDDNSHIVVVARYDKNLNKLYGYYDLDQRKEIVKPIYEFARPWLGYYGMVLTPNLCLITPDGKLINYNYKLSNKHTNYNFPAYCFEGYEETMKNFVLQNKAPWDFGRMGIAKKLIKLKDNIYLVHFSYVSPHITGRTKYALVSNIEKNPTIISEIFQNCHIRRDEKSENEVQEIYVEHFINYSKERYNECWKKLLFNGTTIDIINNSVSKTSELGASNEINYLLSKNNNSSFLLPQHNEDNETDFDDDDYSTSLTIKQKNELANYKDFRPNSNNNNDCNIDYISQIKEIDKFGNVLFEYTSKKGNYRNYGICSKDGQNIFVDKSEFIETDNNGNIILKITYGSSGRKIVSNQDGNIIIGPAVDIIPGNRAYIVKRNDKYQVFDLEGNAISYEAEHQQWAKKLYINKNGIVKQKEERLLIKNYGCTYLLDDTGDIIISQDEKANDIFAELKLITGETDKIDSKKIKKIKEM